MLTRVRFLGHPVHDMLVPLPIGMLGAATLFDLVDTARGRHDLARASYANLSTGVICSLTAAMFGLADWTSIPGRTRANRYGLIHGIGNILVATCFATSLLSRRGRFARLPSVTNVVLEATGFLLMLGTAWLGAEMVNRLGVGVYDDARVDASPSSVALDGVGHISAPSGGIELR